LIFRNVYQEQKDNDDANIRRIAFSLLGWGGKGARFLSTHWGHTKHWSKAGPFLSAEERARALFCPLQAPCDGPYDHRTNETTDDARSNQTSENSLALSLVVA